MLNGIGRYEMQCKCTVTLFRRLHGLEKNINIQLFISNDVLFISDDVLFMVCGS